MFNNKSPFYIRPSLSTELLSWGMKFIKSSTQKKVKEAATALLEISLYSKELYEQLSKVAGFDFALEKNGIIMYYKTPKKEDEELHVAEKARSMGLIVEALDKTQVQKLEPEFELDILGAVHYHCDAHLYPNKLIAQLIKHLQGTGVAIHRHSPVQHIIIENGFIKKVIAGNCEYESDIIVMAAGSWLPEIAKMAHLNIPMMPGKGYSFTNDKPQKKLNVPAILCEARVAITPMNGHMRYGGTMEIAAVNNKINLNRVEGIVESVTKYFPDIQLKRPDKKDIWYGFRPCSPDGLPYLGYTNKLKNLIVAGGHAMMGLSLGPATGKIVADLANREQPDVDIKCFQVERFS
jgi:D-amino-acid dehydrogenase